VTILIVINTPLKYVMLKNLLIKKMLKSQLKGVPEAEQEKILKVVSENPELFGKITKEIQDKVKEGKGQMEASMEVISQHQAELKNILQ